MSSARGGGLRGRGRGQPSSQRGASSRGTSSSRGRIFNNTTSTRGNLAGATTLGQPPRQNGRQQPRGSLGANAFGGGQKPAASSFHGPRSQGSWADRYQTLTNLREKERAKAMRLGQIADPDKPRSLADAVTLVGTCQEMCAEFERVQRVVQKDVWAEEVDPANTTSSSVDREPDEARMVKKFRRAAAGLEEQLPSDLRPPHILKQTCDYLFNDVIGNAEALHTVHHFVWDRTRAIRNDFSIQQVTKPEDLRIAIDCYERIARFHIVSLHQLAVQPKPYDKYDPQQEREQLDRTLLSLTQYYDDCHGRIDLPNETEFRTYSIIFQLQDPNPDLEDRVQSWPREVLESAKVQTALRIYAAASSTMDAQGPLKPPAKHSIAQQDWGRFWSLIRSKKVSYLMGCVAETYFNMVRRTTLNTMWQSFKVNPKTPEQDWTIEALCDVFAFDNAEQVYNFFEGFGFSFGDRADGGGQFLNLTTVKGSLPQPSSATMRQVKSRVVELKRFGRTLPAIISGLTFTQALDLEMVNHEEIEEELENAPDVQEMSTMSDFDPTPDDGESLFMPEAQNENVNKAKPTPSTNGLFNPTANAFKPAAAVTSGGFSFGKPSESAESSTNNPFAPKPVQTSANSNPFAPATNSSPFSDAATKPSTMFPPSSTPKSTFSFATPQAAQDQDSSAPKPSLFSAPNTESGGGLFKMNSTAGPAQATDKPAFSFGSTPQATSTNTATPDAEKKLLFQPSAFEWPKKEAPTHSTPPAESKPSPPAGQFSFTQPEASKPFVAPPAFGQPASSTDSPPSNATVQSPPPVAAPPSPTLNNQHLRKSSVQQTKPKHPSPLANSFSAEDDDTVSTQAADPAALNIAKPAVKDLFAPPSTAPSPKQPVESKAVQPLKPPPKPIPVVDLKAVKARISKELYESPTYGFFDQFMEFVVSQVVQEAKTTVDAARAKKLADEFRWNVLAHRYGRLWRDICWRKRLASQAKKRRERNKRRLQESQAPASTNSRSFLESLKASTVATSAYGDRSVRQNGPTRGTEIMSPPLNRSQGTIVNKRPSSSHGTDTAGASRAGHKRLKSTSHVDDHGRISKMAPPSHSVSQSLQRSSYLGFSLSPDAAKTSSTTKTNYFRLKALGITEIAEPDVSRGTKRRRNESIGAAGVTSPILSESGAALIRSPSDHQLATKHSRTSTPKTNDDDEALFARLKAARENLREGAVFMSSERTRMEDTAGLANSTSSNGESPSLTRARADARLRATSYGESPDVPAYRLRESKFVPREDYGKAIERSKEFRLSRSQESSRPGSRTGQSEAIQSTFDTSLLDSPHDQSRDVEMLGTQVTATSNPPLFASFSKPEPPTNSPFTTFTGQPSTTSAFGAPQSLSSFGQSKPASNAASPFPNAGLASGLAFGAPSTAGPQDFTVAQSQIGTSLKNSFGPSSASKADGLNGHDHGAVSFGNLQNSPGPSEPSSTSAFRPTSYLGSQNASGVISLDSEDENQPQSNHASFTPSALHSRLTNGNMDGETVMEAEDDAADLGVASFGHANPFGALEEEGMTDDDNEDEEAEEDDFSADEENYGRAEQGFHYEDDANANGDVEDFDEDLGSVEDEEEEEEEYDEDDDEGEAGPYYTGTYPPPAPKNEALQGVGGTEDDAIELSD